MVLLVNTVQQMEIKKEKHVMESIQQMENNCKSSSKGLDQITEDFLWIGIIWVISVWASVLLVQGLFQWV